MKFILIEDFLSLQKQYVMSTLEIRNEILEIVQNEDENSLKNLYKIIKKYKNQKLLDKMIAEGEEDIKNGNFYGIEEARKMIK